MNQVSFPLPKTLKIQLFVQLNCQQKAEYYQQERGKLAAPFLENGMIIGMKRTFRIEKMVGGGGFGQIYSAIDSVSKGKSDQNFIEIIQESKLVVAVKVERKSQDSGRIVLELNILVQLSHSSHVPKVVSLPWCPFF